MTQKKSHTVNASLSTKLKVPKFYHRRWNIVRLQTKWLWVRVPLQSLKLHLNSRLFRARSSLTFKATIECAFTLKSVRDMLRTYSQINWSIRLKKEGFLHLDSLIPKIKEIHMKSLIKAIQSQVTLPFDLSDDLNVSAPTFTTRETFDMELFIGLTMWST